MAKGIIKNYTFNTATKAITLTDITTVRLDKIALITDVTTNKILYNFADSTVATATVSTNVITLSALQGGEANSDKLNIVYDVESSDTSAFADTTQPFSAASLPLPSGASTAAKQPALGTAGTASSDVITVQGIASMTALKTDGSATTQPVSGTVTANQGGTWTVQPGNTANTTAWKVDGSAVTQPVSLTSTTLTGTSDTNVKQLNGTTIDTNSGVKSAGTLRVVLATDQPQLTNKLLVTPDANSQVDVNKVGGTAIDTNSGNKSAGTQRVVLATDQPNLTTPLNVFTIPATSGGFSVFNGTSGRGSTALTNTAQAIKASAGQVFGWYIYNPNSVAVYVQLYNIASGSVTVGTSNPLMMLTIPPQAAANVMTETGIAFGTAISAAATSTATGGSAATTAPDVTVFYK